MKLMKVRTDALHRSYTTVILLDGKLPIKVY